MYLCYDDDFWCTFNVLALERIAAMATYFITSDFDLKKTIHSFMS